MLLLSEVFKNFRNICIDMLLLADVFENFRNMCIENYKLDPAKYLAAPGWAWQKALKKNKVKLDLLTDIDVMVQSMLMIQKRYKRRNMSLYLLICKS